MITAHIAGIPIEETLAMGGPALLTALGALGAQLRARRISRRSPARGRGRREPDGTVPSRRCANT
jgi:hypothetical protein